MINGIRVVGKKFLVKNRAVTGVCVDVENGLNIVINTTNGLKKYSIEDLIELATC